MKREAWTFVLMATMMAASLSTQAALYGDTPDDRHAWAVHDWNRPKPVKVTAARVPGKPPSDAIVLFDGTKASFLKNWCDEKGNPPGWTFDARTHSFHTVPEWKNGGDIRTRESFGDCQLHIEFCHDPKQLFADRGPQMRGNSGILLMSNYEIQVLESYYTSRNLKGKAEYVDNYADGQAGSVYAENPPLVNPANRPGEWQTYDIIFHQPVWKEGQLAHPGSVTVFFNGVLVQDHWEMEGLTTHCCRRPLAPHADKLPLRLQDHGCVVYFRNIWLRPLASRWANKTHSAMSADTEDVMKLRRKIAEVLFNRIPDKNAVTAENVKALAEVISYADEGIWAETFRKVLEAYKAKHGDHHEVDGVNGAIDILIRNHLVGDDYKVSY